MDAFVWAVFTAIIWGVVPLLEKIGLSKTDPFTGLFFRSLGVLVGLLLLVMFVVKPEQIKNISLRSACLLVLAGFLASFLGQICFYHALKLGGISRIVPISAAYPLIAFILGILVLKESFTVMNLIGAASIFFGIIALKIG